VRKAGAIEPGDRLCKVNGRVVTTAPWHHIVDLLKAFKIGDTASLTFKRVYAVGDAQARCNPLPNSLSIAHRAAEAAAVATAVREEAEAAVARAMAAAAADEHEHAETESSEDDDALAAVSGAAVEDVSATKDKDKAASAQQPPLPATLLSGKITVDVLRASGLRDMQVSCLFVLRERTGLVAQA